MGSYYLMGTKFQFCKMKRVLEMDGGDACTTICNVLIPWNYALKMVKMVNFMLCVFYLNKIWCGEKKASGKRYI